MEETKTIFESLDWVVLGLYFAILVGVAVWVALQKNKNTEDYFLAGRNVGWFVIGYFCLQYRLRACSWPCRYWFFLRDTTCSLRITCLDSSVARMAFSPILHKEWCLYNARIP